MDTLSLRKICGLRTSKLNPEADRMLSRSYTKRSAIEIESSLNLTWIAPAETYREEELR